MSDPINQLSGDHSQVNRLFNRWFHLGGTEPAMETALAITGLLKVHTTLEEELVYPVLKTLDEQMADKAQGEHQQAKEIIAEIEAMPADGSRPGDGTAEQRGALSAAMDRLQQAVTAHVEEEENVVFPKLTAACPPEDLDAMGHAMYARRQELLGEDDQGATGTLTGIAGLEGTPKL